MLPIYPTDAPKDEPIEDVTGIESPVSTTSRLRKPGLTAKWQHAGIGLVHCTVMLTAGPAIQALDTWIETWPGEVPAGTRKSPQY